MCKVHKVAGYLAPFVVLAIDAFSRPSSLIAQDFEHAPIHYETTQTDNPVARLQANLDQDKARLPFDDRVGYLKGVLEALNVPVASQTLVYSKTSLQRHRISPQTPRAIYFADDVYIGFCQHGDVLELSAVDPQLGAVFYTLDQESSEKPRFKRHADNCLMCHGSSNTRNVPGHFIRSVYVEPTGLPALHMGTHRIDHTSPLSKRWGGWYVTGTHGDQLHLGNLIVTGKEERGIFDNSAGQNVTDLTLRFPTSAYLSSHSDLVALMVLEHQAEGQNLITRANYHAREALFSEVRLNRELGEPEGHRWDSTNSRIRSATTDLVTYLLFCNETPLTAKIQGTTTFAEEFTIRGPRDSKGRSLREFDLQRRIFKYPCSYLIYSPSFQGLPAESRQLALRQIHDVLTGAIQTNQFAHLSRADRAAILEILQETLPDLPDYWKAKTEP